METSTSELFSVKGSSVGEAPVSKSKDDRLGFSHYVDSVAAFLLDPNTSLPLTLSIEGPWGSGKSSFMLLLQEQIEKLRTTKDARSERIINHKIIRFSAWQNEKDETLWASFALSFIRELSAKLPFRKRIIANLRLTKQRLDWEGEGSLKLLRIALFALAVVCFAVWGTWNAYHHIDSIGISDGTGIISGIGRAGVVSGVIAAMSEAWRHAKKMLGNPLAIKLRQIIKAPDYKSRISFLENFQRDFQKVLDAYLANDERVFVFIDDLDRCSIPQAANLAHALNALMGVESNRLVFILGLDRRVVAAGIVAKYHQVMRYLAQDGTAVPKTALEYGYVFLEKFIQIPFRVPIPTRESLQRWLSTSSQQERGGGAERAQEILFHIAEDSRKFQVIIWTLAPVFEFNPRRIKRLVNVFRLQCVIAYQIGILELSNENKKEALTPSRLGALTAIVLRWPDIIQDLTIDPKLLQKIWQIERSDQNLAARYWSEKFTGFKDIFTSEEYSLAYVNIFPLLQICPLRTTAQRGEPPPNPEFQSQTEREDVRRDRELAKVKSMRKSA